MSRSCFFLADERVLIVHKEIPYLHHHLRPSVSSRIMLAIGVAKNDHTCCRVEVMRDTPYRERVYRQNVNRSSATHALAGRVTLTGQTK